MRNTRIALALIAALYAAPLAAQTSVFPQTLPPNTVVGRLGGTTSGPAQAIPFSRLGITPPTISQTISIPGASTTFTSVQNGAIVSRSNSGSPMADTLPGTSPGVLPVGTSITVANTDTLGIQSVKVGAGAVFKTATATTGYVYICPGQTVRFFSDGSNYWAIHPPVRCRFSTNTSIFVSAAGSNSNDGLTSGAALADPGFAYALVQNFFDINGKTVTFSVANGTYGQVSISGPLVGTGGITSYSRTVLPVQFVGNAGSPSSVIISASGSFGAVQVENQAVANFNGFQITNSASSGLFAHNGAMVQIQNINFGATSTFNQIVSQFFSDVVLFGNYTISAGTGCHMITSNMGQIETNGAITPVVTLTGTPNFTTAFACVQYPGLITIQGPVTYSGAATGARYSVGTLGAIVGTGSITFFPGNAVGSTSGGGQYN